MLQSEAPVLHPRVEETGGIFLESIEGYYVLTNAWFILELMYTIFVPKKRKPNECMENIVLEYSAPIIHRLPRPCGNHT